MKLVINKCFGGFGLSPLAVKTIAERQGKKCFFFSHEVSITEKDRYKPIKGMPKNNSLFWVAFSIPNPNEFLFDKKPWHEMTGTEKRESNQRYESVELDKRYNDEHRADPLLVSIVEELGEQANGRCADLKIVEIPDGTNYEISEYDGLEHIAEKHATWG